MDDVMQEVAEQVPHLVGHMYLDRDWIWYCGPSLKGEEKKATREKLKAIGFRFSPEGHPMPDGETTGTWGHSCLKPMFPKRKGQPRAKDEGEPTGVEALAALGF